MGIKIIIVLLLAGLIFSLTGGLVYLLRDKGKTKRTVYLLGIRLLFAGALMAVIIYGLSSGKLEPNAPWDNPATRALEKNQP